MKITWFSNAPWCASGYGVQTALFAPRLQQKLGQNVTILTNVGLVGSVLNFQSVPVFPGGFEPFSEDVIAPHCEHTKSDVLLTLMDPWVLSPHRWPKVRWVPWAPVDTEPIAPPVLGRLRHALQVLVFSRHAERECVQNGLEPVYVPLAIDLKEFRRIPKQNARQELAWPSDRFIVGIVADNRSGWERKSWPEHIEAFARFKQKKPDALLYIHAMLDGRRKGADLSMICQIHGLEYGRDYICPEPYLHQIGLPARYLAHAYSAFDVLLSATQGEGFGIPIVEAQACGTPVIVGEWTASGELCFAGWKIPRGEAERKYEMIHAYRYKPRVDAIVARLLQAYGSSGSEQIAKEAMAGAAQFEVDKITEEYWRPALARIEERLREVPEPVEVAA